MIFTPTKTEEKYIDALKSSTHGEFILIRMTPTMLKKSIIDASHSFRLLLKENLDIDYEAIGRGAKQGLTKEVELLVNGKLQTRTISYYRPKTKKGDPRFWISRLHNEIKPFDMVLFTIWNGKLYALPLIGDIQLFISVLKEIFKINTSTLPIEVLELQTMIKRIYCKGWIKTLKAGDTGVGYTFETLIGIKANSNKDPDYKGIEIKCSRLNTSTLQTLFSKTPNYSSLPNKRKDLVTRHGYWDREKKRYALYMTIKVNQENSKGWKLELDHDQERIYIVKNKERIIYYEYHILKESLAKKHKTTIFIKAQSQKRKKGNDINEEFLYKSAFYCEDSSFINFITLVEEGQISLDFAIHHDPETGKTRDHGFLWRIKKEFIPLLFKRQVNLYIEDIDC